MKKFIICLLAAAIISFSPYAASFCSAQGAWESVLFSGDFGDYRKRSSEYEGEEFMLNTSAQQRADLLMSNRSHINEKDDAGRTALMQAVVCDDADVVKVLLNRGADVNAIDQYGQASLLLACGTAGHGTEIVRILLQAGADVNLKDRFDGCTALMWSAMCGNIETVSVLVKAGADLNIKDDDGKTARDYADDRDENEEIIAMLDARR